MSNQQAVERITPLAQTTEETFDARIPGFRGPGGALVVAAGFRSRYRLDRRIPPGEEVRT